jgi:hypothetical protein
MSFLKDVILFPFPFFKGLYKLLPFLQVEQSIKDK